MVKKLSNLNPSYILITFTPFHLENKNYYSLQCSIAGSLHPIIFFSLKNLKKLLFNCNYKPIFENKYMINKHEHKSIGPNKFFFKDLLFKKIQIIITNSCCIRFFKVNLVVKNHRHFFHGLDTQENARMLLKILKFIILQQYQCQEKNCLKIIDLIL